MSKGKAVKIKGKNALIALEKEENPCSMCKSPCVQKSCEKTKRVCVWARNAVGAKLRDDVEIKETGKIPVAVLYGILCLVLPIAAAAAEFSAASVRGFSEGLCILLCACTFIASEVLAAIIADFIAKRFPPYSVVKVILPRHNENSENK